MTTPQHDPYAGKALLGAMVRAAAAEAVHNEVTMPDVRRVNDIVVGESFINKLVNDGGMITQIPYDDSQFPTQEQLDREDARELHRIIRWAVENRHHTYLAGESPTDWIIRLLTDTPTGLDSDDRNDA